MSQPLVICVCGPLACGKSTLARELAASLALPKLSSAVARLHAAHLPAGAADREELHTYAADDHTYRTLGVETAAALARHAGAVVDATFLSAGDRAEFRQGLDVMAARVVFIECRAPAAVIALRMAGDGHTRASVLALLQQLEWEPLDDVAAADHIVIRTDRRTRSVVRELIAVIAERLEPHAAGATVESLAC